MTGSGSDSDPLGRLAEEFLARHRRGERPALTEYVARHPNLAEQVRDLFPALLLLEDVRPGPHTAGGASPSAAAPRRLGEYRIVREVGRGGMGVVYEAEQESLGRRVALKILPPGAQANPTLAERFQREARAAARLHHTNIVPVFAVGEEGGTSYYVMQYIEGCPLNEVLAELRHARAQETAPPGGPAGAGAAHRIATDVARSLCGGRSSGPAGQAPAGPDEGPTHSAHPAGPPPGPAAQLPQGPALPAAEVRPCEGAASSSSLAGPHRSYAKNVAHVGAQVADALEYAAGQGVLHRDVKPSNLLLDVWGAVWLTDFGLAKTSGSGDLTGTGDLLGTLRYMAPERFRGHADARSDVYSLGVTLYEMLALRPAFDADGQGELIQQITLVGVPRLGGLAPGLPRDLVTIVHKAVAIDPADRYQTAGALAEDLRRFLEDRPILARRVGLLEQGWRWCRRNPAGAGLAAAVLALVLLATGGGLWLERQRAERRAEAARRQGLARQAVEAALERADPRRARGRWQEALAVLAQAEDRIDEAGSEELRRRLTQARANVELATRLDAIRVERAAFVDGEFVGPRAAQDYAAAFAEAGLTLAAGKETAERIRRSAIREQLVAALDDWGLATSDGFLRWQLEQLARAADPDPRWRDRLPGLLVWDKRAALERLAAEAPADKLSPQFLTLLGVRLREAGADPERFLRRAQELHPSDFWLNYDLGMALLRKPQPAEALGFFRAALAARPDCSHIHNKIGMALLLLGRPDGAVTAYRRAIDLDRKNSGAHYNLAEVHFEQGRIELAVAEYRRAIEAEPGAATAPHDKLGEALEARGQVWEAMTEYRRAIARDPRATTPHHNLGRLLRAQGQIDEAMKELRRAIALDPQADEAHFQLGRCLETRGQWDQAMAEYRRAIALDPQSGPAHYHLGAALQARGRADEAIAQFRTTVQVDPRGALGHDALAAALLRRGRFAAACAAARRALDQFPADEPLRPSMRRTLEQAERLLALEARLPALLEERARPADAGERLGQARLFREHGRPYAAARLYAAAFAARPALADDLGSRNRYDAACAAARAAADPGGDGARLGEPERAGLRRQALDWLRADLPLRAKQRQGHKSAGETLKAWQTDDALAGVRGPAPLEKLPAGERKQWRQFWADVDAALADDPLEQGRALAARREWALAAECYARALGRDPTDEGHFWFEYAALLLLSGDRPGYAKACARMVERCGKAPDLRAYHVARACTLAPNSVADGARPGQLAQKELTGQTREFWSLTEQGALLYRAGRFEQAVPLFERSLRAGPQPGRAVLNWLWLAQAQQRLGKTEEARRWLGKAQAWLDEYGGMPARAEEELGLHLHNWLEAHALRREAEALLAPGAAAPPNK
jgi:serine/threonine protein kinase/Flp pilus assembly protein TadD